MSGPLSLPIANRTMYFVFPFICKYVDNMSLAVPSHGVDYTLNSLNSFNKHIQFTCGLETNKKLLFLNVTLIKSNNSKLITRWFTKPNY